MNKKGFTLLELMTVLVIISVVSVSSIIVFDTANDESAIVSRRDQYKAIQRDAILFLDMNDTWLSQFVNKGYMFIKLNELQNKNYVNPNLVDPVTYEDIPSHYLVRVYIDDDKINSCIVETTENDGIRCISNSDGNRCECCPGLYDTTLDDVPEDAEFYNPKC